jgi:two-component system OmpR family sensor kinase
MINVDFENFFIALKNIIDNGLKYSLDGKVSIMIENDVLKISNKAHPLKMPFEHYLEPFERGQNNTTSGMGLGLYITKEILAQHNIIMINSYHDNIFTIVLDLKAIKVQF